MKKKDYQVSVSRFMINDSNNGVSRFMHIFSYIVLVSGMLFMGVVFRWIALPYKIMNIYNVKVLNEPVKAGENVEILVDAEKYMNLPARVITEVQNDHTWLFPEERSNVPVGRQQRSIPVRVPRQGATGNNYRVHRTYIYNPNPLREIRIEWTSKPFNVVGKDK